MSDDPPANVLMTRAANGDKQAGEALVERYAPLIWSICRRYQLSSADAADIGQAIWPQVMDQLGKVRDLAALTGWLAATTQRECGKVRRAAHGPQAAGKALAAETTPDDQTGNAEQELLLAELHATLREALIGLPPRCQQLITLLTADPPPAGRPDQRQAGHPRRQHRVQAHPLPGQATPRSGDRCPARRPRRGRARQAVPAGSGAALTIGQWPR
jgi:RNA polymerase sigma factor (sigma-70 family)